MAETSPVFVKFCYLKTSAIALSSGLSLSTQKSFVSPDPQPVHSAPQPLVACGGGDPHVGGKNKGKEREEVGAERGGERDKIPKRHFFPTFSLY